MEKQRICIIGGGLTGLITAITLSKLNIDIDLVSTISKNIKSNRTVAISENNYEFIKKLNIFNFKKNELWPCLNMRLYTQEKDQLNEILHISGEKKKKNVFFIVNNFLIIKKMLLNIKKNKSIKLIKKKVVGIFNFESFKCVKFEKNKSSKYDLIIVCTGNNSKLLKYFPDKKSFSKTYNEAAVTTLLDHSPLKNNTARQIFLDDSILALLPVSNTKTSIVWSLKKKVFEIANKEVLIKKKINLYVKNFLKKIKPIKKIEYNDLNLSLRNRYFQGRILFFGDILHTVHPLAGQGFNMIIRDLIVLKKILNERISLGLDIGSFDVLSRFERDIKSKNFVYSTGIDILKKSFSFHNQTFKKIRNSIILKINKNKLIKDFLVNIADKGLKF